MVAVSSRPDHCSADAGMRRSYTPVSVKKPPLVIAAWQALYRHYKSPHSFSFLVFFIVSEEIIIIIIMRTNNRRSEAETRRNSNCGVI